jgi:hypothetical protein
VDSACSNFTVAPMPARSKLSAVMAMYQPRSSSPTRLATGIRASSKNTSANGVSPRMSVIGRTVTPGVAVSTSRNVMPLCFGASGLVRTSTNSQSAC